MIKDAFGAWDWDGIKQLVFSISVLLVIISFAASTSGNWYDPYSWFYGILTANEPLTILIVMFALMALWWHEQFNGGFY